MSWYAWVSSGWVERVLKSYGAGRGGAGRITLFRSLRRGLARPVKSHGFCLAVVKLCALMVRRFRLQASRKASLYSGAVKIRNSQ